MTSSGTYAYNPPFGDLLLEAYSRIQIPPTAITRDHMRNAYHSANLLLAEWANQNGPNLWEVSLINVPLVQGTATYSVPGNVIGILDYFIRTNQGQSNQTDYVIYPISRTEYADQPNKLSQARPTTVWWDRLISSNVTLWQTPDQTGFYILYMWVVTQIQDAVLPNGATMDLPYRFLDAFAAGLAAKLARKYPPPAPTTVADLQADADRSWALAANADIENVPMFLGLGLQSYSRI